MSPHTQRVRGLAHAWLLIRDVCRSSGLDWEFRIWSWRAVGGLSPACVRYDRAVERYGAGPR